MADEPTKAPPTEAPIEAPATDDVPNLDATPSEPVGIPTTTAPEQEGSDGSGSWDRTGLVFKLEAETGSEYGRRSDSDTASIATSLSGSATDFRYEHGRRYHAYSEASYSLPNDEQEMSRLELQHLIWNMVFNNRLYLSPLPSTITDALDIGTGTGNWAIEFANQHPNCSIIGTDLSPIQPDYIPINCSFIIDDANNDWPTSFQGKFDFIHTRALGMGIRNWDRFVEQAYACLKPGGWLELQEFHFPLSCDDGSLKEGDPLQVWSQKMKESAAKVGIDVEDGMKHTQRLRDRGFAGVREAKLKGPIGPWAKGRREKEIGILALKDLHDNLEGISSRLFSLLGYGPEKTADIIGKAKADMMNPRIHTYMPIDLAWGQKPLS